MNRKYFFILVFMLFLLIPQKCYAYDFIDAEHTPDNVLCYSSRFDYANRQKFIQLLFLTDSPDDKYLSTYDNVSFYAIYKGQEIKEHGINNLYYLLGVCDTDTTKFINCHTVNFYGVNNIKYDYNSLGNYFQSFSKETLKINPEIFVDHYYVQLVSNPEFAPNVRVFDSVSEFQEFVVNDGLDNPILPDNPPEETGNPKVSFSNGDYCIFNTNNPNIAGCLNSDPGQVYSNGFTHDLELFEIFYNDDFTVVSDKEYFIDCSFYDSEDNFLYDYPVNCKRLNSYATYEYTRPFLVKWDTIVTPCITVNKQCRFENFRFVAPSHNDMFLYLIGDGDFENWPLNPNQPDPDLPGEDIVDPNLPVIPDEWGFIGDLFNSFIGAGNKLLGSISDKLSKTYKSINNGFSKVNGFLADIKNNISEKINSFNASVIEQITNFKETFISTVSGFKESVITAIGTLASDIGDSVSNGFSNVLTVLFIPEDGYINGRIESIRSKFAFADSILNTAQSFFNMFNKISGNNVPSVKVHLSLKSLGASYGKKDVVISLDWYAPYKPTIDTLLSGILWAGYIWLIIKRVPDLIKGSGMITENLLSINKSR